MESLYDRAISEVGQDGKLQRYFDLMYNTILSAVWIIPFNSIILILAITPHTCRIPEKNVNISDFSWKSMHIPISKDVNGEDKFSSCLLYTNPNERNVTEACEIYDYDKTWYESTIPSENHWMCDSDIKATSILSYSRFGEIGGSLFFAWFGDVFGRKLTYIISLVLLVFGRLMATFASNSYVLVAIGCIIASFPSTSAVQSTAVISIEMSSPKRRATMAKLRSVAGSLGMAIMPLLYWWIRDWKPFLIISVTMLLPYLVMSWNILESPQWLWVAGQNEACVRQLQRIAKTNNRKLETETEKEILNSSSMKEVELLSFLALFSGWQLTKNTILQLGFWLCVVLNYTVILMSSGEKRDGNPFIELSWQSLAEIPGYFIAAWLADHIGRRYTGVTSFCFTAILWALTSLREMCTISWIKSGWLGTVLVILNKTSLTVSYYIIELFNMELYPTCMRQSGMSLGNVIAGGGGAAAHWLVYLGRQCDPRLPGALLSVISLIGAFFSFCLPETLNTKLPETLEDARNFGSSKQPNLTIPLNLTAGEVNIDAEE